MSLHDEVVTWAASRPWWQQRALVRLARGEVFGEADIASLMSDVFSPEPSPPAGGWVATLTEAQETVGEPVVLLGIRDVRNVNRLTAGQTLTFAAQGVTVVFGQNGSGKSGYARIIQSMVRTRTKANILPNVFGSTGACRGELVYRVGASQRTATLDGEPPVELARAAFYDEHTGNDYLTSESEVLYRPAMLRVLDDLATTCDRIRARITDQKSALDSQQIALPAVTTGSSKDNFLKGLAAQITDAAIKAQCVAPADAEEQLQALRAEEARLVATDPAAEKQRLTGLASATNVLAAHLDSLRNAFSPAAEQGLTGTRAAVESTRRAAEMAAQLNFDHEPLPGVGEAAWRAMWESAASFSETTYPGHDFPHTAEDAVCVLCQQPLSEVGKTRLQRFAQYVADDTAQKAAAAQAALTRLLQDIHAVETEPAHIVRCIATLEAANEPLGASADLHLDFHGARQRSLLDPTAPYVGPVQSVTVAQELRARGKALAEQSATISADSFNQTLTQVRAEQRALKDVIAMRNGIDAVKKQRDREKERERLNIGFSSANTRGITEKIADWTRRFVTEASTDRFTRETDRLALENVTLRDAHARKGAVYQRPGFLATTVSATLPSVLSEGEQTALGLAGFLTEAYLDVSKSAGIFDDPVSSLDHVRREKVANRLVEFAEDRQVIVFTHDASFTADLRRACDYHKVTFTERAVERSAAKVPGFTSEKHPWTVKAAASRIHELKNDVAALARNLEGMTHDDYCEQVRRIAGKMSETWERIISQEIAERLVDHRTLNVQPKMMKVVANVSADDETVFQQSYSRISGWAPRHDNHPETNWTPPEVGDVQKEVDLIEAWFNRVKKYSN